MDGFESLSPHRNLFVAAVIKPVVRQVLDAIESWTALAAIFPFLIGVRTGNRLILLFRHPDEEHGATESTALAMTAAYGADELFVCFSTDVLQGLKAFLVTRAKNSEGIGYFFELTAKPDKWIIGNTVGKIDPNILGDFAGAAAFKGFNDVEQRGRMHEAREALAKWQPLYDWKFDPLPAG